MADRARVWASLLVTYISVAVAARILWTGGAHVSVEMLAVALGVATAETGALEVLARASGRRWWDPSRPLGFWAFFIVWFVLVFAVGLVTPVVSLLVFRDLDLSAEAAFLVLMMPTAQAAVLLVFTGAHRSWRLRLVWRRLAAHPLAWPVLWIDAVMALAGVVLLRHPLLGFGAAGIVQRRWLGTKMIAAAAFLVVAAVRPGDRFASQMDRAAIATLGGVLAAIGLDGFVPWLLRAAGHVPAPLSSQPAPFLWLEVYGGMLMTVLALAHRAVRTLDRRAPEAASLIGAGAGVLFPATLSLIMNGFLSLEPVEPWAAIALAAGSTASTLFVIAAILVAIPPNQ